MNDNLITLTVNSTHFFLIDCKDGGKLLVDAGWEMVQFTAQMKAYKLSFSEIRYLMFTHTHPDHAGLIQNVKNAAGARLIIQATQIPLLKYMRAYSDQLSQFEPVQVGVNDLVSPDRSALKSIGIFGEILETPGHSVDSISLVLDNGAAFIGDLPLPDFVAPEKSGQVRESWRRLLALNAQTFYPSHSKPFPADQIRSRL